MALASLGALIAMAVTLAINLALQRDFATEWAESFRVKQTEPLGEEAIGRMLENRDALGPPRLSSAATARASATRRRARSTSVGSSPSGCADLHAQLRMPRSAPARRSRGMSSLVCRPGREEPGQQRPRRRPARRRSARAPPDARRGELEVRGQRRACPARARAARSASDSSCAFASASPTAVVDEHDGAGHRAHQ